MEFTIKYRFLGPNFNKRAVFPGVGGGSLLCLVSSAGGSWFKILQKRILSQEFECKTVYLEGEGNDGRVGENETEEMRKWRVRCQTSSVWGQ